MKSSLSRTGPVLAAAALLLGTTAGACAGPGSESDGGAGRTNVVFVLTDDLSANLVQYMPNVRALAADGTTFSQYTVTDSLCCPSRSSILTGRYPHNTGVFTNSGDDGGFHVFQQEQERDTFATTLHDQGYRTAMMGKYLNGYQPQEHGVRPGWTEWDVAGGGYNEYDYNLNENGTVKHYGKAPEDYLTTVIEGKATSFITASAAAGEPFLLEVSTFTPHGPYTPAPQDEQAFPGLTTPRGPSFDRLPTDAPAWLAGRKPLTARQITMTDTAYRKRAQSVLSIDRMIGHLRQTLEQAGVADRTVVDGRSLLTLLRDGAAPNWRKAGLIEHHGPGSAADDPDKQAPAGGTPPTYAALRAPEFTYVEYEGGVREYYDRTTDPDELANTAARLPADRAAELHETLEKLRACQGSNACG